MSPEIPRYMLPNSGLPVYPVAPGSVPSMPELPRGNVGHQRYQVTVPAGASVSVVAEGDFFKVDTLRFGQNVAQGAYMPAPPISIKATPDGNREDIPIYGPGSFSGFPRPFSQIVFRNPNTVDVLIVVWVGFGNFSLPLNRVAPIYGNSAASVLAGAGGAYAITDAVGNADGSVTSQGLFTGLCPEGYRGIVIRRAILKCSAYVAATNVKAWIYNSDNFPNFVDNAIAPVYGGAGQGVQIAFPTVLSAWTGAVAFGLAEWNGLDLCINRGLNNGDFMFGLSCEGVFTNNNATYVLELGVEFR